MPKITFTPQGIGIEVDPQTKVLAAAIRSKAPIRFGCASCRCGTCGVSISGDGKLTAMKPDEKALLTRMQLPVDGSVRLACQTRILNGEIAVDLDFQNTYSPDQGDDYLDDEEDD